MTTIRKFPGGLWTPPPISFVDGAAEINEETINDTGVTAIMYTIRAPKSGTLDKFEVNLRSVSVDSASTVDFFIYSLDADGLPDTLLVYRNEAVDHWTGIEWIEPGLMTDDGTDLGNRLVVTRGQKLGLGVSFADFSPGDAAGFAVLNVGEDSPYRMPFGFLEFNSGWSRTADNYAAPLAVKYAEASDPLRYAKVQGTYPVQTIYTGVLGEDLASNTTPDERGMTFTFPADVRIGGAYFYCNREDTLLDVNAVLYDELNAGVATGTVTLLPTGGDVYRYFGCTFPNDILIEANKLYRLTLKPSSTATFRLAEMLIPKLDFSLAIIESLEGGSTWHQCYRTDDGTFTDVDNVRPLISLVVTGLEQGGSNDPGWEGDA